MSNHTTCARFDCTAETALGSPFCVAHGSVQIKLLYFLVENKIRNCVPWPFSVNGTGYGTLNSKFTNQASRYACALLHGLPEPGMVGAHNCGNGNLGCVNPHHLRWATHTENMDDKNEHAVHRRLHGKPIPIKPHKIKRPELREPMLVDLSKLKPKRPELIVAVEKVPPRVYVADARTPNQFMHWTLVDGKPKPLIEANPDRYYALRGVQKWHEYMVREGQKRRASAN